MLAGLGLAGVAGCNPSLAMTLGLDPVALLDPPDGTLLIMVMNTADTAAVATVAVNKTNGGQLELKIPALPFSTAHDLDHVTVIQDCDVTSIQLLGVTVAGVGEIASDRPPLAMGVSLSCGDVVVIWITQAQNYFANLSVF